MRVMRIIFDALEGPQKDSEKAMMELETKDELRHSWLQPC